MTDRLTPPQAVQAYCPRCHETQTLCLVEANMERLINIYACKHCGWQVEISTHFARDLPQPTVETLGDR